MTNYKILEPTKVINFLINKYYEIDVVTEFNDWQHIKDYQVNDTHWERKFYHPIIGFLDVKESKQELFHHISILGTFRIASKRNNLPLIKNLFSRLLAETNDPNRGFQFDTEYNLTNACRRGNLEIIKYLVENGVNIHVENELNVITALKNYHYDVVEYFLETDKRINLEVIYSHPDIDVNLIKFVKNWELYQTLNNEITNGTKSKASLKI